MKPTMAKAGYAFIRQDGPRCIIVQDRETGRYERWSANKNHASYGFHYRNTDWEYVHSIGYSKP